MMVLDLYDTSGRVHIEEYRSTKGVDKGPEFRTNVQGSICYSSLQNPLTGRHSTVDLFHCCKIYEIHQIASRKLIAGYEIVLVLRSRCNCSANLIAKHS